MLYLIFLKLLTHSSSLVFEFENVPSLKYARTAETKITLKGQVKLFREFKLILFLGHPV